MDAAVYSPVVKVKVFRKIKIRTVVFGGFLVVFAISIKIFSHYPILVERYYSVGLYPQVSTFYRSIFGWLPFSLGDVFYFATGSYLLLLLIKMGRAIYQRRLLKTDLFYKVERFLFALLVVYIYFNLSWGLNYNRPGIAVQLELSPERHNESDLKEIAGILLTKINVIRRQIGTVKILCKPYPTMFFEAQQAYQMASVDFSFMTYKAASVKRSMYGRMGNYLGFLGYYNPFTGEAQLNLTMPRFLIPYVTCHEMAHQLGYASESEASFVGYLAAVRSKDTLFQYSTYFDLFGYANHELYLRDSAAAKSNYKLLDTLVKSDMAEVKEYWRKSDNVIEPVIRIFYDHYLKANQQSKGVKSYNEVIGWLIAYHKKYGKV